MTLPVAPVAPVAGAGIAARLRAAPEPGSTWQHRSSGRRYVVTGLALDEETLDVRVEYRAPDDPPEVVPWSRRLAVFLARFERVL